MIIIAIGKIQTVITNVRQCISSLRTKKKKNSD